MQKVFFSLTRNGPTAHVKQREYDTFRRQDLYNNLYKERHQLLYVVGEVQELMAAYSYRNSYSIAELISEAWGQHSVFKDAAFGVLRNPYCIECCRPRQRPLEWTAGGRSS